jgi:hypothetical protein
MDVEKAIHVMEDFLYKFISDEVSQEATVREEKGNWKAAKISRLEKAKKKNRDRKAAHKANVAKLKKDGLYGDAYANKVNRIWRSLIKEGNRIRVSLAEALLDSVQRKAIKKFRADPHKYARELFKGKQEKKNDLEKESCESYFPKLYTDPGRQHTYKIAPGMVRPPPPTIPFNLEEPTWKEFMYSIKRKRNKSSPGRNGIGYVWYKKLDIAATYLFNIIKMGWNKTVSKEWAEAVVVLIHKSGDLKDPSNYRPIALTNCSGKIFFSIYAKRMEDFFLQNDYIKRSKQKGFLSGVAGCIEHVTALKAAFADAKASRRQIITSWIDLTNAFGSVSHNLSQFALWYYHVPKEIAVFVFKYYEKLVATIEGEDWSTDAFGYEIGVFQGCVWSPILFNMVFNLLLDLLSNTEDIGYMITMG